MSIEAAHSSAGSADGYFYADFISGRVWSLGLALDAAGEATVTDRVEHTSELSGAGALGNLSAFGVDSAGELYRPVRGHHPQDRA